MNWKEKNVLVTGGNGFLGSFVVDELHKKNVKNIIIPSSTNNDLRKADNCKNIMRNVDIVFHLAAKVGGIGENRAKPADFFYDNIMMGTQVLHEAKNNGVEKFIGLGTICSYPKFTQIPFLEESIWDGYPEETNAPYGLAKKMILVQSQAYRKQYDFNSIVIFPTNLYGLRDNFDLTSSHVIPALIKKIYNAKKSNNSLTVWGDGTPTRDFLYVEDAARGIMLAAEKYNDPLPINLGSGKEISIKELVSLLIKIMDFTGKVIWDSSKPNGQLRRCVSIKRAEKKLGFRPLVSFEEGLQKTVSWFFDNVMNK